MVTEIRSLRAPDVPVIVNVDIARGVVRLVRTVSRDVPEPVTGFVLQDADAPEGRPVTDTVIAPENPPVLVTVMG